LYNDFTDIKQTFDNVWQRGLRQVLRNNNGIPEKMVNLFENIYSKSASALCVDGELSAWFEVTVGVEQGCNQIFST